MGNIWFRQSEEQDIELGHRNGTELQLEVIGDYLELCKALHDGNLNLVRNILDSDPEVLTARITTDSETALHVAIKVWKFPGIINLLIRRMSVENLSELRDRYGDTVLSVSAKVGLVDVAEELVRKNPNLPNICGKSGFPIHTAAQYGQEKMVRYLFKEDVTLRNIEPSPFEGRNGAQLLNDIITAEFYDIACDFLKEKSDLATVVEEEMELPLNILAVKTHDFPDKFYDRLITMSEHNRKKHLQNLKSRRDRRYASAIDLVQLLCTIICQEDEALAVAMLRKPLLTAVQLGTHVVVEEIVKAFPHVIWATLDEELHNVFQLAILHRQGKVLNFLLNERSHFKDNSVRNCKDQSDNNILHLVGRQPHPDRLTLTMPAALQVQEELKWFEEVEELVVPAEREAKNRDDKTPWMVFTESHRELIKEGEKWMKKTGGALTVMSALVTTISFAAAVSFIVALRFTDAGLKAISEGPLRAPIIRYIVANVLSFIFAVLANIAFLAIATSPYSERSYLKSLPGKLIWGLVMLFFSITSLMLTLSFGIYIIFRSTVTILFVVYSGEVVIIVLINMMILPLVVSFIMATYRRRIFGK